MSPEIQKQLYKSLLRIRRIEEAVADRYSKKEMRCPVHLSIGQEAVPVGISLYLTNEDRVYSTHRCHAHYLAKGGDLKQMIAELHGRATGCAKGKGGSMHLVDTDVGMMGSSALVGGTIPLAVGSALAFSQAGTPHVSVGFFGDGATEEGILYESLNFAALKKLPSIFVCENNLYATYSHVSARQANTQIWKRAEAMGVASCQIDGNDVLAVAAVAEEAVRRARNGEGPTFIEAKTYRWRDHVGPAGDVEIGYRTAEEVETWMAKCPIKRLRETLIAQDALSLVEDGVIEGWIGSEIDEAFKFAVESPYPDKTEIMSDIYA